MSAIRYRRPGPTLQRVDLDVSAAGACQDCPKHFRSFERSCQHAAGEQHTVRVTETRLYDVTPRDRQAAS